jgi:hypothetical protein
LSEIYPSLDANRDAPSLDAILSESAERLLNEQSKALDALDRKMAEVFGVGSTVLPVTVALLTFASREGSISVPKVVGLLVIAALFAYLGLVIVYLSSTRSRDFAFRPRIEDVAHYATPRVETAPDGSRLLSSVVAAEELRRWVAQEQIDSIEANRPVIELRAKELRWTTRALCVEAGFLGLASILALLTN